MEKPDCFTADEKMHMETYQNLLNLLEMTHIDNMKILKALIYPKDDIQPLIDGSTRTRVCSNILFFQLNSPSLYVSYLGV